jgi:zinc protease
MSRKKDSISEHYLQKEAVLLKTSKKGIFSKKKAFFLGSLLLLVSVGLFQSPGLYAASVTDGVLRETLENGFTVILKEDHSSPVASVQVWVKTGSANETRREAGITHFIEHMIFKGTPTRKTGEIARTIESSGGRINAYTTYDRTVYYVEIASSHFDTALDVLLDAVQHSLFDPAELEKEKEVVLEEYRRSLDLPRNRLNWALMDLSYTKHPYRRPIIGYETSIRDFDREAVVNYMNKWYTADNMVLVAVGDFNAGKALQKVKDLVRGFPRKTAQAPARPEEPEQTSVRKLIMKDNVQQVYLDICWHVPSVTHDDMPALDLLEVILGDGKSSRLYNRLKMESNLVHSIGAGSYALADPGLFLVEATLKADDLKNALEAISKEMTKVRQDPVSKAELSKAKTIAEAQFLYEMETMNGQARSLGFFETMTGNVFHSDQYLQRLKSVSSDDIERVSRTYLKPDKLSLVMMVPEGSEVTLSKDEITGLFTPGPEPRPLPGERNTKEDGGITRTTLSNGAKIIVKENHRLPLVSLTAAFLGGARLETAHTAGLSEFVARMLTRGTQEKSASEIAGAVEALAGTLEGFSGKNSFGVSAKFLSKDLPQGLDLVADVLLRPTFPEAEMEKVRKDTLAEIKAKGDRPTAELFDLFYDTLYRQHPYGHPETGTRESIQSVKRTDLVTWYQNLVLPSNFVLAVVGDVDAQALIQEVEALFGGMKASPLDLPAVPPEPPLKEPRRAHLKRQGAQTHLVMGFLGTDVRSPDNAPMALIETALSGLGGRLFFQLRDKQSLAYAVTAFRRPGLETGAFGVYMACEPGKLPVARDAILKELEKLRENGLTNEELRAAKKYLVGTLKIGLQTNGSQAMHMALDELYGLGYDHTQRFMEEVEGVTKEDVKRAARRVILPDRFVYVTLGPDASD